MRTSRLGQTQLPHARDKYIQIDITSDIGLTANSLEEGRTAES